MHPADTKYAELVKAGLPSQFCLTWCEEHDLDEVARRFGADVETGLWADEDDIEELEEEYPAELLQLVAVGDWTVALEPGGFQGSRSVVMEALSVGTRAFSVYWNVELDSAVSYAVDGVVRTTFDLVEVEGRTGADPSALDPLLREVGLRAGLTVPELKARSLALGERLSGALLIPDWLRHPRYVFKIVNPLPDELVPFAYRYPRAPFLDEPEFARILADPSPSMAAAVTRQVAVTVIAIAAIEDPLAEEVLRLLDHGERSTGERERLRELLIQDAGALMEQAKLLGDGLEAERLTLAGKALLVLDRTLEPLPTEAARSSARMARGLHVPDRASYMRLVVLGNVIERISQYVD
ncbi:DUF6461 domain-containing protein [Acrocarpospora catenulata]|uniref:DUF6461 domain-containing protein n=1 Tax=Acrocarpospora catenulata TaxID=2836182 RepID=UPI001BD9139E|nr:DUF6461 domain-containing protein [Acrocarpospora catenulata]